MVNAVYGNNSLIVPSFRDPVKTIKEDPKFLALELLNKANSNKSKIYVKNGSIERIRLEGNWFKKFCRIVFLINFFQHTIRGHSSNDKKVFQVINKTILNVDNIKLTASDGVYLREALKATKCAIDILTAKYSKNPFKKAAFESLKEKVEGINSKTLPKFIQLKENNNNHKGIASSNNIAGTISSAKSVQEPELIETFTLPSIDDYCLPKIRINKERIKEKFRQVQTKLIKRKESLKDLKIAFKVFQENKPTFDRLQEKLDKMKIALTENSKPVSEAPVGVIPPPPPPPPPASKGLPGQPKVTWREREAAKFSKEVRLSEESKCLCDKVKAENILKNSYKVIVESLFPGQKVFNVDMSDLEPFIAKFQMLATDEIKGLKKCLAENNPLKGAILRKIDGEVLKEDEFEGLSKEAINKIKNIRHTLKVLSSQKQTHATKQAKLESLNTNKNSETKQLNDLSEKCISNSNEAEKENQEKECLKLYESIVASSEIENVKKEIDDLGVNIKVSLSTLQKQTTFSEADEQTLVAAANKLVEDLLSGDLEIKKENNVENLMEKIKNSPSVIPVSEDTLPPFSDESEWSEN